MVNYVEFLNIPAKIAIIIVGVFLVVQIIGELIEFKGKTVPEFIKIRKYFVRKKKEKQAFSQMIVLLEEYNQMCTTLKDVQRLLNDIDKHYSADNIAMRDGWMKEVNDHMSKSNERRARQDELMNALNEKLDKNNDATLSILIENKRSAIIDFASKVIDESYPVTREQFNRIFKIYEEYEVIIADNGRTNGEVDIAYRIIKESYEKHMKGHSFVEDARGY